MCFDAQFSKCNLNILNYFKYLKHKVNCNLFIIMQNILSIIHFIIYFIEEISFFDFK